MHASNLMKAIRLRDPQAEFRAWGGDRMLNEGAVIVKHINELAFMGFVEVLLNLSTIIKNLKFCKEDILEYNPDVVIFIDYPGFNLRIAEFAKKNHFKTVYYISPQVWAWKQSRVKKIRRDIDKMLVILPFEEAFYNEYDYPVTFVGHPLLDALEQKDTEISGSDLTVEHKLIDKPVIALLPGSRKQEINRMLELMCKTSDNFPDYQFVIAGVSAHSIDFYKKYSGKRDIPIIFGHTYQLLRIAHAALVTSGTATLETALIGTPQVVCYKAGAISYYIARKLVDVKYISLVNLIMDEQVVKELIQNDCNSVNLKSELAKITEKGIYRENIINKYEELRIKLGGSGASEKAAKEIVEFLED